MRLTSPVIITPRLLPGVQIGRAFISITYSKRAGDETRTRYQYYVDLPFERGDTVAVACDDLQSGCQGGSLQEGLASLLSFLAACGESVYWSRRNGNAGENSDLFPTEVGEWAASYSDELSMLAIELEETPDLITE